MDNYENELASALRTGFIDGNHVSREDLRPQLLVNDQKKGMKVMPFLRAELEKCKDFAFSVAFVTEGGVELFLNSFEQLREKGVRGRIIVSDYLNFNEPKALRRLLDFDNLDVKILIGQNMHAKSYIFQKENGVSVVIGSSNMTETALTENNEWNVYLSATKDGGFVGQVTERYDENWLDAVPLTNEWINDYEKRYKSFGEPVSLDGAGGRHGSVEPNSMQKEALERINGLRELGENRALLISATGTGKTYLSAFDVQRFNPGRMLFVVHREQIAREALDSFRRIFGETRSYGLLSGTHAEVGADFVFATMQSLSRDYNLTRFLPDTFDYIVIDEAHRVGVKSYFKILNYFAPKFMLGMTATPERGDGYNIYELFDYNIAYEIRLQRALAEKMLCPFHYFGVSEIMVDGEVLDDNAMFNNLVSDQRVNHIIEKVRFYGHYGARTKGLIFCSRNEEATELSRKFNERGLRTVALSGSTSQEERERQVERLSADEGDVLDYIFVVDIFNEGVDIPEVNQIVMLRPTQSAIIFVQQLGRGLRKAPNKKYVVVIDFIGNYANNFMIPIALSGDRTRNKDNLRRYLISGDSTIPGSSTVMFDKLTESRIFDSINNARLSQFMQIREEYFNLKNKIGRIPWLKDFYEYGSIDPELILNLKNLIPNQPTSYATFLAKVEKNEGFLFDDIANRILSFVSLQVCTAKRPHEIVLMRMLLENHTVSYADFASELSDKYGIVNDNEGMIAAVNFLQGNFLAEVDLKKYGDGCRLVEISDRTVSRSEVLERSLDERLVTFINDVLGYAESLIDEKYLNRYMDTDLVLNEKYSRRDVCRLLNWKKDCSMTIYGYTVTDKYCPIFVTYRKDLDISKSTQYEDAFVGRDSFSWMTRSRLSLTSPEVEKIRNARGEGRKIYLFVKKDDAEGRDFYFLGEVDPVSARETTIEDDRGKILPIVNFRLKLRDAVREDIYKYLMR